jgi:hypothetical protein
MSTYYVLPRIVSPTGYCTWFLVMLHATYWLYHWYTKMTNTSQVETLLPSFRRSERDDPPSRTHLKVSLSLMYEYYLRIVWEDSSSQKRQKDFDLISLETSSRHRVRYRTKTNGL